MEITKLPETILAKRVKEASLSDIKAGRYDQLILEMKQAMKENKTE